MSDKVRNAFRSAMQSAGAAFGVRQTPAVAGHLRVDAVQLVYRPEIDGLRAVAVYAVMFYHAGLFGLSSGFAGVDVFFVISGFLITSIIAGDISASRFSFAEFYQRRARRIFPALAVMLAVTLFIGLIIFTPSRLSGLGVAAAWTSAFSSNIHFWKSVDYFSRDALHSPLLHTWSLAIEEQFYLFHPVALLVLARFSRAVQKVAILTAAVLSFGLAVYLFHTRPSAAFYLLPARAWELLAGAAVALGYLPSLKAPRFWNAAAWCGLAMVGFAIFDPFSVSALRIAPIALAVGGSCLLIHAYVQGASAAKWLLAAGPAVLLGQASYSIYLWHQPVLAFAEYLTLSHLSVPARLGLCLAATGIALFSYRFIEAPFRRHNAGGRRFVYAGTALAAMLAAGTAGLVLQKADGMPSRFTATTLAVLDAERDRFRHPVHCMNDDSIVATPETPCVLGNTAAAPRVLLWGDSHAMVTATAMEDAARRAGASFLFAATADCPFTLGAGPDPTVSPGFVSGANYAYCRDYNDAMLKRVQEDPTITDIVISTRWSNWRIGQPGSPSEGTVDIRLKDDRGTAESLAGNREIFERGFRRMMAALGPLGRRIWLVGPYPEMKSAVPETMFVRRYGLAGQAPDITEAEHATRSRFITALLRDVEGPDVRIITPADQLCGTGTCPAEADGVPLYLDDNHLTVAASRSISSLFDGVFTK